MTKQIDARKGWLAMTVVAVVVGGFLVLLAIVLWLNFGAHTGPRLQVNVQPSGATVIVDDQSVGKTPLAFPMDPGQHVVRIEAEHYIPWVTTVWMGESDIALERTLVFQPFISTLAKGAVFPQWTPDGTLLYITEAPPSNIVRWNGTQAEALAELSYAPASVEWSSDNSHAAARMLSSETADLDLATFSDHKTIRVGEDVFGPAWKPDGKTLTFAGWLPTSSSEFSVWSVEPGATPTPLMAQVPKEMYETTAAAWSPDGNWLFTINGTGLILWQATDSGLSNAATLPAVSYAAWSPDSSQIELAYLSATDNTLSLTSPTRLNPTSLALNVSQPIRWSKDGATLYYFDYRPAEGGSAFWALNPETRGRTLLADASIAFGKVIDFAVSPDGKRVAYVTDEHRLVLLTLGE